MPQVVLFKRGCDIGPELRADDEVSVSCTVCHRVESDEAAYETGWQFEPAVCPDCLHWTAVAACECVPPS